MVGSLWTQSAKLTADSIEHDEIPGVSQLSGLGQLNSGLKRWHLNLQFIKGKCVLCSGAPLTLQYLGNCKLILISS